MTFDSAEAIACYRRRYLHTERQSCVATIRQRSVVMTGVLNLDSSGPDASSGTACGPMAAEPATRPPSSRHPG
jgi:hypothetical protein